MLHILALVLAFLVSIPTAFERSSYTRMVDHVSDSVVRVTGTIVVAQFDDQQQGSRPIYMQASNYVCSGFVIGPDTVMTAGHCLGDSITADGQPATVVKVDKFYDLMILHVKTSKRALALRDAPVTRFEDLTGIGYGWGWNQLSVKHGPVYLQDYGPDGLAPGNWVETGWIGGMSGGPIVDASGDVVGIVQRSDGRIGYGVGILFVRAFLVGV